jgi:hypothetical protein
LLLALAFVPALLEAAAIAAAAAGDWTILDMLRI